MSFHGLRRPLHLSGFHQHDVKFSPGQPPVQPLLQRTGFQTDGGNGATETFPTTSPEAAFFAREPWPSRQTGPNLRSGRIDPGSPLAIISRIDEGGVIFADGVEITLAPECLRLDV